MKCRKHPVELAPPQAAVIWVIDEIVVVVPADEVISQRGKEGYAGDDSDKGHGQPRRRRYIGAARCGLA
ncbi:MAG: hypothetical protein Q8S00_16025 [Deltaproteobacteria bacterium]|nr:hypothetical protein [Deltaproteobacteria bacterium]